MSEAVENLRSGRGRLQGRDVGPAVGFRSRLKRLKEELRRRMHLKVEDTAKWLGRMVELLRRPDQFSISIPICRSPDAAVASTFAP